MTNYLNPEIENLASDAAFVRWVREGMPENQRIDFENTDAETIQKAARLVRELEFESYAYPKEREEALFQRISDSMEASDNKNNNKKPGLRKGILYLTATLAACLLVLLIFIMPGETANYNTRSAEKLNLVLPDGSSLVMNSVSHISYDKSEYGDKRTVALEGEAFFNVEKGESFVVETGLGFVEVLGTSFNVLARDGRFEVSCVTGKVKVADLSRSSFVILQAGQSCKLAGGKIVRTENTFREEEWIEGIYHFDNARLVDVISEMERQYDIEVQLEPGLEEIKYTGFFKSEDLEQAFESVLWPLRLEYRQEGEQFIIFNKEQD